MMKKYADEKRLPKEFVVGDMVLVKLQPYRQHYCFQEESEAKFKVLWPFSCGGKNWCCCI